MLRTGWSLRTPQSYWRLFTGCLDRSKPTLRKEVRDMQTVFDFTGIATFVTAGVIALSIPTLAIYVAIRRKYKFPEEWRAIKQEVKAPKYNGKSIDLIA